MRGVSSFTNSYDMSRWEKFPLAAFGLILLLLGIVHRYHLQSTVSGKSRHLQPPILRDEKLESQEESRSSLIASDTRTHSVKTDYHSSESTTTTTTTTSETHTTSTSMNSASAAESNLVVFYNRLDPPFSCRLNFPAIKDPKDWLRKYGLHHQETVQAE